MAETRLPAGVDPMDPKIIEEMRSGADRVEAENRPPDSLVEAQDLTDTQTIAGFRCRPMSAGLFALLELVKAPILSSDAEMATMSEIQAALPVMLERFQSAMDLYGGDGDKKK